MAGTAFTYTSFTPVHNDVELDHAGKINVATANVFGLYGLSNKTNITFSLPFKHWRQSEVEHEDSHHRNEAQSGPGDISLGLRRIIKNQFFGPGQRFFIDGAIVLPTGKDYAINPFGPEADTVEHSHFASGTGQISFSGGMEWWRRSEFPLVLGITSRFTLPLTESRAGFTPGFVFRTTLHAIKQTPLFPSVFPYVTLELRREWPDQWEGATAPNSGAVFLDVTGQLIYERDENSSLVVAVGYPLWQVLEGSQLSGIHFALSLRFSSL
ncbi:MAG: hypothetical protein ACE5D8_06850 [Fidelibacterota bacterium]